MLPSEKESLFVLKTLITYIP